MASKLKNQLHTYPPGASETGCAYPYCPDPVANNIVLDDLNAVIAQTNLTNEIQQLVAVGLPTQSALTAEYYHIVCDEEYVDPGQLSGMVADFCLCYEDPELAASYRIDCEILSDVYWYHPDYVGSNELITDITGEPYQYFFYTPFGETILQEDAFSASYDNPWRFNDSQEGSTASDEGSARSAELDAETGNYYYGARYYNPKWSVWLSVDAMAGKYLEWTPYCFALDNPVLLRDLDGKDIWEIVDGQLKLKRQTSDNYNIFQTSSGQEIFRTNSKMDLTGWATAEEQIEAYHEVLVAIYKYPDVLKQMEERAEETGFDTRVLQEGVKELGDIARDYVESKAPLDAFFETGKELLIPTPDIPIVDEFQTAMPFVDYMINQGGIQAMDNAVKDFIDAINEWWFNEASTGLNMMGDQSNW